MSTPADIYRSTPGYVYGVAIAYTDVVPMYYFITKGNTLRDELGEHFATANEAEERAAELNRADVLATLDLDPVSADRRERLKSLGETFEVSYGEGHPEARWPTKPGRYAVESYSERYSESFWDTYDSLDEVTAQIKSGCVEAVYDLDVGRFLEWDVSVSFVPTEPS